MNDDLQNKLKELKKAYLIKIEGQILAFRTLQENKETINVDEIYPDVHKISGTSGMYGLSELSDISTEFELYLKEIKNNTVGSSELKQRFSEYIKKIELIAKKG